MNWYVAEYQIELGFEDEPPLEQKKLLYRYGNTGSRTYGNTGIREYGNTGIRDM